MKKHFLKTILVLAAVLAPTMAFAVCENLDGNCLDQALRSLDRVDNNISGANLGEDMTNGVTFYTAVGVFRQSLLTQQMNVALLKKLANEEKNKDVSEAYSSAAAMIVMNLCMPQKLAARQSRQIVRNYLNAHPEEWGNSIDSLLRKAFTSTFPCQKGG